MSRTRADKEATLREVLAEVSLLDVGRLLKQTLLALGCLSVFYAVVGLAVFFTGEATGIGFNDLGIPDWVFWLALTWIYTWCATNERSFHELQLEWYFPKLGWLGSLLLAAYIVGCGMVSKPVFAMEHGVSKAVAILVVLLGCLGPFILFFSAINIGHKKLMEKRMSVRTE